jgi:PAS domain S-box-containing protein
MPPYKITPRKFQCLREQAEALIRRGEGEAAAEMPPDFLELIQELQIHQAELEIQNEELLRAQVEIAKLQTEYENLYEFAPCGYLTLNAKGRIVRVNLTGTRLLEVHRESAIGASLSRFFDPPWRETLADSLRQTGETGERQSVDLRLKGGEPSDRWVRADIEAEPYPNGSVIRWRVVLTDITARRQAQREMRESQKKYQTLFERANDAIFVARAETGTILDANRQAEQLLGKPREEIIGTHQSALHPVEERDQCLAHFHGDVQRKRADPFRDLSILHRDGRKIPVEISSAVIEYQGNPCVLGIFRDVTRQKKAEEALRLRERFLGGLNQAAFALLEAEGTVPYQTFVERIGPPSTADRAYVFLNHAGPDGDLRMRQVAEWRADGVAPEIDNPLPRDLSYAEWMPEGKDVLFRGDSFNARVRDLAETERHVLEAQGVRAVLMIPIFVDDAFFGFIGFDNRRSEAEWSPVLRTYLQAAAAHLAQAVKRVRSEQELHGSLKEKEVLLREIHHRVKNNLNVIISLLRMHARRTENTEIQEIFGDCQHRIEAMSLIHESLYQADAPLSRIDFQTYLRKLCRNLCHAHNAARKRIEVRADTTGLWLDMDQGIAVGMVISELVSNAFKHAFPLGKGGNQRIRMRRIPERRIELVVENDGKPMPPDIDIHNSPSLGLRLVTTTVTRQLGGSIAVERGNGTRFTIRFPCKND